MFEDFGVPYLSDINNQMGCPPFRSQAPDTVYAHDNRPSKCVPSIESMHDFPVYGMISFKFAE
jgi:hypothetical protein